MTRIPMNARMGNSTTAVPLTVFCPSCSDIVQYDRRINAVVPKWSLRSSDFVFNIEYGEDETGPLRVVGPVAMTYATKSKVWLPRHNQLPGKKCGKIGPSTCPPEMVEGGRYHNGYFICSVEEFKRVAKKGHEVASGIAPAVEFGGTTYAISLSKFITFWKEMQVDGERMVGIPRIYWKEV